MGVRGLTSLLEQHGWIPSLKGCLTSLWRDELTAIDRIETIPFGSTLAIDGNGLAFHLFDVAYSRHWESLGLSLNKKSDVEDCSCPRGLTEEIIVQCLPQSVPLQILDRVTREFASELIERGMTLVVYWDGKIQRFKAETAKERRAIRAQQWTHLRLWCQFGTLPFQAPCCRRKFYSSFPTPNLILHQVKSTLSSITCIQHIQCIGEADADVARASSVSSNTFCVGKDSDYWLFRDTKYVPFATLHVSMNAVTACVMTRDNVSSLLHLPSSESLVELGILLGNDYIKRGDSISHSFKSPEAAIEFLQFQADDFRVGTTSQTVQQILDFVRTLYSLEPLDDFPVDQSINEDELTENYSDKPVFPASFDLSLIAIGPFEFSSRRAVLRPLQAYVDQTPDCDSLTITQSHLDTFNTLINTLEVDEDIKCLRASAGFCRPIWEDILATYVIERTIAHIWSNFASIPIIRHSLPSRLFDALSFQAMMNTARNSEPSAAAMAPLPAGSNENRTVKIEKAQQGVDFVQTLKLPIDEFENDIIEAVRNQRVTVIQGETGCGKSSRVPVMLLREPVPHHELSEVKIFVSQPRRIAVKALVERIRSCEPDLREKIALRMGHGEREYETAKTRAWFVTTGYLVRLLANHPERFNDVSHLIVDEVHERSIDADVLCLLCKRLLKSNQRIKLILMSATLAANMYADYFEVCEPPIKVGARRFPIQEFFVEDLVSKLKLPKKDLQIVNMIKTQCEKTKCRSEPSMAYMTNLYQLAVRTTAAVGQPGSSVLIFVPGMHDIISIIELVEKLYVPGARFTCIPMHSDVPFDEQMTAFEKPADDEIKIIIGTNVAESSITLPDVDHVICLGFHKHIVYNPASHRQLLTPAWISQANAIQRAGRTGRVRNGNVYRLYTRDAFEKYMTRFEIGEMSRVPLDSVILDIKQMLNAEATPVLLQCLEPPQMETIERSFESLYKQRFLSTPDDGGDVTNLGAFVSSIGVDLMLGSLIGLGVQFGVGAEAIEIAAILSFSKSPWVITNLLYHEEQEFNALTSKTFVSRCHFDANLYSEPLSVMNLIWDYELANHKGGFCFKYNLSFSRVKRLVSTRNTLRRRVTEIVGGDAQRFEVKQRPSLMPHAKVVLIRIILVWVLHDNLIYSNQGSGLSEAASITLRKNRIDEEQLNQVLNKDRHPYCLITHDLIEQSGTFALVDQSADFASFLATFEHRFVSYCAENDFKMAWYRTSSNALVLFVLESIAKSSSLDQMREGVLLGFEESLLKATHNVGGNRRGRNGRACGVWKVQPSKEVNGTRLEGTCCVTINRFTTNDKRKVEALAKFLSIKSLQIPNVEKSLSVYFSAGKNKKNKENSFHVISRGQIAGAMSRPDVLDLLATSDNNLIMSSLKREKSSQEVQFKLVPNSPIGVCAPDHLDPTSSWMRPIVNDIPEGARILSVIASSQRRGHHISFAASDLEGAQMIKVEMSRTESRIGERWLSFRNGQNVVVEVNCVPAASLSIDGPVEIFAVAGDSLDLMRGQSLVSGLTLLPPGRLFVLLCMKTFGIHPTNLVYRDDDEEIDSCLHWLEQAPGKVTLGNVTDDEIADKILNAINFHESCYSLCENLECYPEFAVRILSIFDQVDGYHCAPWDGLFASDEHNIETPAAYRAKSRKKQNCTSRYPGSNSTSQVESSDAQCKKHDVTQQAAGVTQATHQVETSTLLQRSTKKKGKQKTNVKAACKMFPVTLCNGNPAPMVEQPSSSMKKKKGTSRQKSISDQDAELDQNSTKNENSEDRFVESQQNSTIKKKEGTWKDETMLNESAELCLNSTKKTNKKKKNKKKALLKQETASDRPDEVPCNSCTGTLKTWFSKKERKLSQVLFSLELVDSNAGGKLDLPSTNILASLVTTWRKLSQRKPTSTVHEAVPSQWAFLVELTQSSDQNCDDSLSLTPSQWQVYRLQDEDGCEWYSAIFTGSMIPLRSLDGRRGVRQWMKGDVIRPSESADAMSCVPHHVVPHLKHWTTTLFINSSTPETIVLFQTLETALRMAAAYWLERQFCDDVRHWYELELQEMEKQLVRWCSHSAECSDARGF